MGNEAHGIRHDYGPDFFQLQPAQRGVQGGKQLVGGIHLGIGQTVEQRRLAGIGIPHQRDGGHFRPSPGPPTLVALAPHFLQPGQNRLDTHPEQTPVGLQLGFAGPTQPDTALLSLEVSPAADQARAHVLQLRELHLQLALMGAGTLGEDVEDQPGTIQHAAFELPLQIALLTGAQRVIENHQLRLVQLHLVQHFPDLAGPYEGARIRYVAAAHNKRDRITPCQQDQFLELAGVFTLVFAGNGEVHQYGALAGCWTLKEHARLGGRLWVRWGRRSARTIWAD